MATPSPSDLVVSKRGVLHDGQRCLQRAQAGALVTHALHLGCTLVGKVKSLRQQIPQRKPKARTLTIVPCIKATNWESLCRDQAAFVLASLDSPELFNHPTLCPAGPDRGPRYSNPCTLLAQQVPTQTPLLAQLPPQPAAEPPALTHHCQGPDNCQPAVV